MRAYLTVQEGPAQGEIITAEQGSMFRVGRQANADLSISDDRAMSGLHFALLCDKSRCRIRDLNSTNGTFVNGIRINLVELHDRDTIRAGNSEFQVRFEGEITTTVVDPLMYPEIQRLREKDAQKLAEGKKPFAPTAQAMSPRALEATEALESTDEYGHEIEQLAKKISAEVENEDSKISDAEATRRSDSVRILRLNVTFEDATGKRHVWLIPGQTVIIGRNQMADVTVVGDASISGMHFGLDCEEKRCRLRDLQSQNGTKLNDVGVPYATIYTGDKFVAGKTEFHVTIDGGEEAPDAPLRTWVFEDLVRRKFATFFAKDVGENYHLIDAVGIEPMPIEFLRRIARHRDVGAIVDTSKVSTEPWEAHSERTFVCEDSHAKVFHIADIEKVVDELRDAWGKDAFAFIFPHEGHEEVIAAYPEAVAKYHQEADSDSPDFGSAGDWVKWLCDHPKRISDLMPNAEAVFIQHPDPKRWRLLCETDFITRLNRLGYLPSKPSALDEMASPD
ncbi:FHA domain protein [Bremerella volcania]|uniref:FHA domain protein n=1 Tax=Bremerella volcania TaxID=2527984 RepID=A0A518CCY5_9BACT|nr:FHA domain-containing protein [Bremerella volcania]QDU77054.1 FHA domain protein [Bremerella volcania]